MEFKDRERKYIERTYFMGPLAPGVREYIQRIFKKIIFFDISKLRKNTSFFILLVIKKANDYAFTCFFLLLFLIITFR